MDRTIVTGAGEREIIGFVAVDSGQILIADPCYVDSHWKKDANDDAVFRRVYRHRDTGAELEYQRDFAHYEAPIASQGGQTMNALNATGEWDRVPNPRVVGLSYAGACSATLGGDGGQMVAPCGGQATGQHFAVGVASSTGYGDGMYPVIVERSADGRVSRLIVDFMLEDGEFADESEMDLQGMKRRLVDSVVTSAKAGDETLKKAA